MTTDTTNTPALVDGLREMLAKATPGPWAFNADNVHAHDGWIAVRPDEYLAASDKAWPWNAGLIVGMHSALPDLLDELEALRASRETQRAANAAELLRKMEKTAAAESRADSLAAELGRVRAQLAAFQRAVKRIDDRVEYRAFTKADIHEVLNDLTNDLVLAASPEGAR